MNTSDTDHPHEFIDLGAGAETAGEGCDWHYTDEDVQAATGAILRAFDEIFCDGLDRKAGPAEHAGAKAYARAVLDAVAPAIAARALREAARTLPGFDSIETHGDAARWLRARADEIEGR